MIKTETINIEFKVDLNKENWKNWLKSFCGFANSQGGEVRFGYSNDGVFIGIPENKVDGYIRHINQMVRIHTNPYISYNVQYEVFDEPNKKGLVGIIVKVPKRNNCLNWLIENDKTPELYIRYEGETHIATLDQMEDLLWLTNKYKFDLIPVGKPMEKVSFSELNEQYAKTNNNEIITDKMLKSFDLITSDGGLTLAGYLFCDNTNCPNANVVCCTWPGNTKGTKDYIDTKTYNGSIIFLMNSIVEYIKNVKYYKFGGIKDGMYRTDTGSFSLNSIREAVVNAFAHRDYQIHGNEIQVNCFPDRIEINSPGSSLIYENSSECKKLESLASVRRNKTICNVLTKCKLMEEKGSGFASILSEYAGFSEEYQPMYISTRASFTLILKNKKYELHGTPLITATKDYLYKELMFKNRVNLYKENKNYEIIELLIANNSKITLDEIALALGITRDGAKYYISKMKEACLVRRVGSNKSGYYELVNDIDRPADILSLPNDIRNKVVEWCKRYFTKSKSFNLKHSSYGLKHILQDLDGTYLSNGQFKAAMLLGGFSYKDVSELNWHFNIAESSSALHLEI